MAKVKKGKGVSPWWMGKGWNWWLGWVVGVVVILVFHGRLFWPEAQVYTTVDYQRSDILQFHWPVKHVLGEYLRQGRLPWWVEEMGTGFPLIAEGQVGAFFLPNLVLFGLLPSWLGMNLAFVVASVTVWLGTVGLMRRMGLAMPVAQGMGLVFALSGWFSSHVVHLTMLQTMAMMPWVWWGVAELDRKWSRWAVVMVGVAVAGQIAAGYFQTVMITWLAVGVWLMWRWWQEKRVNWWVVLVAGLGVGLAMVQLLPSWKLAQVSGVWQRGSETVVEYPYQWQRLVSWIDPRFWGEFDQVVGTSEASLSGWYWENSFFVGVVTLLVALFGLRKWRENMVWIVIGVGFVLVGLLGPGAGVDLVSKVPVLGWFRVPQRGMVVSALAVCVVAGWQLTRWWGEKRLRTMVILVMGVMVIEVMRFGWSVNSAEPVREVLEIKVVTEVKGSRIAVHPAIRQMWEDEFGRVGFGESDGYVFYTKAMPANSQVLWGVESVDVYAGMIPRWQSSYLSNLSPKWLKRAGVEYVLVPGAVDDDQFELVETVESGGEQAAIRVYRNKEVLPKVRLVGSVRNVGSEMQAGELIWQGGLSAMEVVSSELEEVELGEIGGRVELVEDKGDELAVRVESDSEAVMVVNASFGEGWQARVNGLESQVWRVDVNQRAVMVPQGTSVVEMWYEPPGMRLGMWVSLASLVGILGVLFREQMYGLMGRVR